MSVCTWGNDKLYIYKGINILTKNPISYNYFKTHFANTIKFLSEATLTFDHSDDEDYAENLCYTYANFIDEYKTRIWLSDSQSKLINDKGRVTISLLVLLIEYYRWEIQRNALLTSYLQEPNSKDFIKNWELINSWKEIFDKQLLFIWSTSQEIYSFYNKKDFEAMKKLYINQWNWSLERGWFMLALDMVRIVNNGGEKSHMGFWDIEDLRDVDYSLESETNYVWLYLLFNMIFLWQKYSIFCPWSILRMPTKRVSGWSIVDKESMMELYDLNNSGTLLSCALPLSIFGDYISNKEWFAELKKEVQWVYNNLTKWEIVLKANINKLAIHIEKQIKNFPKVEFYVGTKNKDISFIRDIVTQHDPKKYYETQQKIYWNSSGERDIHEKGGTKIFKKKRDISTL